jgi:hypothetical protein
MAIAGMKRIPVATLQCISGNVVPVTIIVERPPSRTIYSETEISSCAGSLEDAAIKLLDGEKVEVDMRDNAIVKLRELCA